MMNHNSENTNAFIIHIAAFGEFFFPFGGIVTTLILWQTLKNRSAFLDQQGREAVNFNISYSLYMFVASMIVVPFFIRSVFTFSACIFSFRRSEGLRTFVFFGSLILCRDTPRS